MKWLPTCPSFSVPGMFQTGAHPTVERDNRKTRQNSIFAWVGERDWIGWTNWIGELRIGFTTTNKQNEFRNQWNFFFLLLFTLISSPFVQLRSQYCYDLINPYLLEKVFRVSFQSTLTPFLSGGESRGRIRDHAWSRILSHRLFRKEPFLLLSLSPFQGQTSRERLEKRRESLVLQRRPGLLQYLSLSFLLGLNNYSALSTLTHARTLTYADSRTLRHLVAATTSTHA